MDTPELRGVRILADLNNAQLHALLRYGSIAEFSPGQIICRQGETSESLFLVLEGKVGVYVSEAHGNEIHLRTIESGGHFPEIGVLEGGNRTATVKALSQCKLFRFDAKAFQDLLKAPELAAPFLHGLSRSLAIRLTDLTNRVGALWSLKDFWTI